MPTPKRLEKLRIWKPGAASRAGAQRASREIPGAGGVGRQKFSFSDFQIADAREFSVSGNLRPTTDPQVSNISIGFRHFRVIHADKQSSVFPQLNS